MRQLLMTMLLIATVAMLYASFAQGEGGANETIARSGNRMADAISRISP
ncbi:hypothetical protein ACFPPD_07730 [Cohnella suwonensis]|uniref:Uncharacterized protein n=1 Tax=Cohnella suwonensis TaxID=696072 RepID=A0ABW0LVJ1_9BACL